jgi:hypothetical protein
VDNKAHDDEFLGGNEDSIGNWTKWQGKVDEYLSDSR